MSLSAHAMLQVVAAKKDHNAHCPWQQPAKEIHIHPDGLEALGWDDGDDVAGLTVVADDRVPRKRLVVYCAGDLQREEAEEIEVALVSRAKLNAKREIVHAGATG